MDTIAGSAGAAGSASAPPARLHGHVRDPDLSRFRLTAARLHEGTRWLLREPNGRLRLDTLGRTPLEATRRAALTLGQRAVPRDVGAASITWERLHRLGYEIVRPRGPYFHPGPASEFWGRSGRFGYWQTHVEVWAPSA